MPVERQSPRCDRSGAGAEIPDRHARLARGARLDAGGISVAPARQRDEAGETAGPPAERAGRRGKSRLMIDPVARPTCPGWQHAEWHLRRVDAVLAPIVRRVGPCTLAPRRDYFGALCQSIVTQQISTRVAVVIYGRLRGLFPDRRPTPAGLLELDTPALRSV